MMAAPFQTVYSLPPISNPGMITPEEEQLYFHLARSFWNPDRFYLEFGTWLGRSTTRICQGLEAAAPGQWQLNCYDLFRWNADHIPKAARAGMPAVVADLKPGDSFREAFLTLMGEHRHRIATFQGMVSDAPKLLAGAFSADAKLGVLFVDAAKGWDNSQLLRAVATHLAPGTRILFQDFFMNSAAYLQLLLMSMPQLTPETVVMEGGSFVFQVVDEISPDHPLLQPGSVRTVTADAIHAACERLEASVPRPKYEQATLAITLPVLLWKQGYEADAHAAAERLTLSDAQRDSVAKRMAKQPILNIPPLEAYIGGRRKGAARPNGS